jgi:non-ribosomal peptide synthetase component F
MSNSIAADGRSRQTELEGSAPESTETLASLFLSVERHHQRTAVVEQRLGDRTERTPDWRFHRHILRLALYLRERFALERGDGVALVAPLCPEWLVVDWATVIQGGSTIVLDPLAPEQQLSAAWRERAPRIALVETEQEAARLLSLPHVAGVLEKVIVLESQSSSDAVVPFLKALELGGTLDTAERANTLRGRAKEVEPGGVALLHPLEGESFSQGAIAARIRPAKPDGARREVRASVIEGMRVPPPAQHIALYGYVADGVTCVTFGGHQGTRQEVRS